MRDACSILLIALVLSVASPVAAQERSSSAPDDGRSTAALTAGGALGGAVGLAAGFLLGAALADDGGDDLDALHGGVAGAAIGESLLLSLGVHLANERGGSLLASAATSLALAGAGLALLDATHYDPPWAPAILVTVPVVQIAASIGIERATGP